MKNELLTLAHICFVSLSESSTSLQNVTIQGSKIPSLDKSFSMRTSPHAVVSLYSGIYLESTDANWGGLSSLTLSADGTSFVGVTDASSIVTGSGLTAVSTAKSIPVQIVGLKDPSSGDSIGVEGVTTLSGMSFVTGTFDGLYVLTDQSVDPLREYSAISKSQFNGLVFIEPSSNPLSQAPSSLSELIDSCIPDARLQSIGSVTPDSPELEGSIIYMCENPSSVDGYVHGWVYDPSTRESNTFMLNPSRGSTMAGMAFCRSCHPSQVFLLSLSDTGFAVDTVALDMLLIDGNVISPATNSASGLLRLFESDSDYQMVSLAVIADPKGQEDLHVYVSSDGFLGKTVVLTYQVRVVSETASAGGTGDTSLSLLILLLLIGLGIVLPLVVMFNPFLRAKFAELRIKYASKPRRAVLLDESDEEMPSRLAIVSKETPKTVGKSGEQRLMNE